MDKNLISIKIIKEIKMMNMIIKMNRENKRDISNDLLVFIIFTTI